MSTGPGRLAGRAAIVTGAGRGIGRAIALAFGAEGAKVAVASRTSSTVEDVVACIRQRGGTAIGVTCDVGRRCDVDAMVAATAEHFGRVDVLVNNAQGFGTPNAPAAEPGNHPIEAFPEDVWAHTFQTGLIGTLYGMQAVFPHMKEQGAGAIINFGSGNGIAGVRGTAAYNCTKEGIRALTRTAAAEWGRYGIRVNDIVPTMVTDAAKAFLASRPGSEEKVRKLSVLGRLGDVERDIGPVAVFLASDDSGFVTGQTMYVNGGQVLRP